MSQPSRLSVVLADDVAGLRKLVRLILEDDGRFQVVAEASNGQEALEATLSLRPDLLLLDLAMPRLDGLQVLQRLGENGDCKTRVVVLSGFYASDMAARTMRLGAVGYLEKGLPPEALVERVLGALAIDRPAGGAKPDGGAAPSREPPSPSWPKTEANRV